MRDILNKPVKSMTVAAFFLSNLALAADDNLFSGTLSASELWDSNFLRDPDDIAASEQISLLTAGVGLTTNLSRQKFSVRWRVRSYQHAEREQFDETFQDGVAKWNGAWAGDVTSNLEWSRDSYLVDRWEADESDVVARDNAKFILTKGRDNRFSFQAGASHAKQQHSNVNFNRLDYEETEGFAGIIYQTPSQSTLALRYRTGDRTYENLEPIGSLDYDFDQFEFENLWKISSKTSSTVTFARFQRKGAIIDSTGDFVVLDFSWDATPKIQWHAGYTYKRPALGDTIDLPTTIETGYLSLSWGLSSKLSLSSRIEKVWRDYSNPGEEFVRKESQFNVAPLTMVYTMNESLSFKLDTSWRRNESPRLDREYEASQAMLGMTFRF